MKEMNVTEAKMVVLHNGLLLSMFRTLQTKKQVRELDAGIIELVTCVVGAAAV